MSKNPYHVTGQEPSLIESVFVFMDILGYKDLIQQSSSDGSQEQVLRKLHVALSEGRKYLEGEAQQPRSGKNLFALKAFTDNIVIGWPVHDSAEAKFGSVLMDLGIFQLLMANEGFFIRGALAVAPAYVDEIAVFGDALTETYIGESQLARDPRIILTRSAIEATKQHLNLHREPSKAPSARDILKDSDGQWFLNYLESVLIAEHEYGPYFDELMQHKKNVEQKLEEHYTNPPVWSKYTWVASYHNYFCNLYPHHFDAKYRIDMDLFRASPELIV